MKELNQRVIDACQECLVHCQTCLNNMAGKESMNDCPSCCIECVDACFIAIKAIANDSKWAKQYVKICSEICEWCATQCGAHDHDHCQRCAASCRKCVEVCKEYLAAA